MSREPVYHAYIDWYGHGGLASGLSHWHKDLNEPSTVSTSNEQDFIGGESLKVVPEDNSEGTLAKTFLVPAEVAVTISVWVYVEGTTDVTVDLEDSSGVIASQSSSLKDEWVEFSFPLDFDNDSEVTAEVRMPSHVSDTEHFYLGWSSVVSAEDEISEYVLATRQVPDVVYGRDAARDLASVRTGEISLELNNEDGRFTPNNGIVSYAPYIGSKRQVLLTAEHLGKRYIIYNGYTDKFSLKAKVSDSSVAFSCVDLLTKLANTPIHTDMYESIRTGDAVKVILNAADVYNTILRDVPVSGDWELINVSIDTGATTLRMWSYSGDAKEGLDNILSAEGPPSIYTVGISNQVIYRDRHHRVRHSYPSTPTKTFTWCDPGTLGDDEYLLHESSEIDYGLDSFYNRVEYTASVRSIESTENTIWTDPIVNRTFFGRLVITADVPPYVDAVKPVPAKRVKTNIPGAEDEVNVNIGFEPEEYDFIVESGSVTVDEYSTSGTRIRLVLTASGVSTISGLQMRGRPIKSDTTQGVQEDTGSQTYNREVVIKEYDAGDAGTNDAESVSMYMLKLNGVPRPFVTARIKNLDERTTAMILNSDISDLVHMDHAGWNIDQPFVTEAIEHIAGELGKDHELVLSMQQAEPGLSNNPLVTFDSEGQGFDVAVFAEFSNPGFKFGTADRGFGDAAFGFNARTDTPFILGSSKLNTSDELWY